jgi:CubicO group peptidase (beta-lactamase class C family)
MVRDIDAGRYDGGVVLAARHGQVFLHEAVGYRDQAAQVPMTTDAYFALMSVSKSISATLVLSRIDHGDIALTTRVADILPEFAAQGKAATTVAQLLSHTGGVPGDTIADSGRGDLAAVARRISAMPPVWPPGAVVGYSAWAAHSVLGEVVRRIDGGRRSYSSIIAEDLFRPLAMVSTSVGWQPDFESQRVPVVSRKSGVDGAPDARVDEHEALTGPGAEIPGSGMYSTAADCFRFTEMLRRGGELDGRRVLSRRLVRLATSNQTGERPHSSLTASRAYGPLTSNWPSGIPAYLGFGFHLRGIGVFPVYCGLLASAGTYGHMGRGSTVLWTDPESGLTFIGLTAGVMEETASVERWQYLSDLVHAAAGEMDRPGDG